MVCFPTYLHFSTFIRTKVAMKTTSLIILSAIAICLVAPCVCANESDVSVLDEIQQNVKDIQRLQTKLARTMGTLPATSFACVTIEPCVICNW